MNADEQPGLTPRDILFAMRFGRDVPRASSDLIVQARRHDAEAIRYEKSRLQADVERARWHRIKAADLRKRARAASR